METYVHPRSGEKIVGDRLLPGSEIGKNDKYDRSDGKWGSAGNSLAGLVIQSDCTTIWVRQP